MSATRTTTLVRTQPRRRAMTFQGKMTFQRKVTNAASALRNPIRLAATHKCRTLVSSIQSRNEGGRQGECVKAAGMPRTACRGLYCPHKALCGSFFGPFAGPFPELKGRSCRRGRGDETHTTSLVGNLRCITWCRPAGRLNFISTLTSSSFALLTIRKLACGAV